MLKTGDKAPEFTLLDADENEMSLKDFKGQSIVIYFYPKDNTPGCATEAIDFSEAIETFCEHNAVVLGVSKDSTVSHKKFIAKHNLKVILLSDPEATLIEAYGVWREKKNYGKTYMGIVRSTFLIDDKGVIQEIWDNVCVKGHVEKVVACLIGEGA